MNKFKIKKSAFSLTEIIVVIALVSLSFMAVMSLSQRVLQMENMVKNEFVAQNLAREGLELAEAVRNSNLSNSAFFYTDLVTSGPPPVNGQNDRLLLDAASVKYGSRSITHGVATVTTASAKLKLDTSDLTKMYQHSSGSDTLFYRVLETTYMDASGNTKAYLIVASIVTWSEHGKSHTNRLTAKLYDR